MRWLPVFASVIGIDQLHRLRDFLAQVAHESAQFAYTREIGGEGRRYAPWFGRGIIQLTWLRNYQAFVRWLRKVFGLDSHPDYSTAAHREKVATELKVSFLTAIFFWQWKKLNQYSDTGNFRQQTKVINGGFNGWSDRVKLRGRFGLMLLGYKIEFRAYAKFQEAHGLAVTDRYDDATEQKMLELLKEAPALGSETKGKPTMKDLFDKITGFFGAGPLGAVAGSLITAIFANFGGGEMPDPGLLQELLGDLKNTDGNALTALAAAIASALGAMSEAGKKPPAEPGDDTLPDGTDLNSDPMFFRAINIANIQRTLGRVHRGLLPSAPDEGEYTDFTLRALEGGVDSIEDGILLGIDWGQDTAIKGLRERGELNEKGAPPAPMG
ncbi:MAG: hypothetical protein AAF441_21985 [Pseudomonadota bacterium]